MNDHVWGTGPLLWDSGNIITKSGVVYLIDEDAEGSSLSIWVWLEFGVDLNYEDRSHCGEQTGLLSGYYVHLSNLQPKDSQRLILCSDPCHILQPPFDNLPRIKTEDPLESSIYLAFDCRRDLATFWRHETPYPSPDFPLFVMVLLLFCFSFGSCLKSGVR